MASRYLRNNTKAKNDTIGGIVFLSLVVIGILIAILYGSGVFDSFSQKKIKTNPDITENPNISYPGYSELVFQADNRKQDVYLHNPDENTCYFKMTIALSDGRTIWQSGYLEPGDAFNNIKLSEALEKGTYENAVLHYDSFSIKDGRQLNGSSINMTITVN